LRLIIENLQPKELQLIAELLTVAQNAGKEANKFYSINIDQKIGVTSFYATVHHYAFNDSGKWAYNNSCFIGTGKLWG